MADDNVTDADIVPVETVAKTMGPQGYDAATIMPVILERIETGESLRQICRDAGMPTEALIRKWGERDEWCARYARAREIGWGHVGEDLLEIADDSRNDWMERESEKGRVETVLDREHIERTKLRIETRKWMLAKMLPKVYGDRLQIDTNVATVVAFVDLTSRSTDETNVIDAPPFVPVPDGAPDAT